MDIITELVDWYDREVEERKESIDSDDIEEAIARAMTDGRLQAPESVSMRAAGYLADGIHNSLSDDYWQYPAQMELAEALMPGDDSWWDSWHESLRARDYVAYATEDHYAQLASVATARGDSSLGAEVVGYVLYGSENIDGMLCENAEGDWYQLRGELEPQVWERLCRKHLTNSGALV